MTTDADEFIDKLTDPLPEDVSAHIIALWTEADFNSPYEAFAAIKQYLIGVYGEEADIVIDMDHKGGFTLTVEHDKEET